MKVGGGESDVAAMKPAVPWLESFEHGAGKGVPTSDPTTRKQSEVRLSSIRSRTTPEMAPAFFGPKLSFDGRRMSMRGAGRISERERISDLRSICMKRRRPWGEWW